MIRILYDYIGEIHQKARASIAARPDGALVMAAVQVDHPKALMLFTNPRPRVVRMMTPDDVTAASPGCLLAVPVEYEELRPPGETWQQGRLAALRWLHRQGAAYPLECVTVHDGTVGRDWLASERDLFLLVRESA